MPACLNCSRSKVKCSLVESPSEGACARCMRQNSACDQPVPYHLKGQQKTHRVTKMPKNTTLHMLPARNRGIPQLQTSRRVADSSCDIDKVVCSIDAGTAYMKAAVKVFYRARYTRPRVGTDKGLLASLEPVTWPNKQYSVPSVIAYHCWGPEGDESGEAQFRQMWGYEAVKALGDGKIDNNRVFRLLKPALYDGAEHSAEEQARRDIDDRIRNLPPVAQFSARDHEGDGNTRQLTCLDIYSDLLKHAWRHILLRVKQGHPSLPWTHAELTDPSVSFDVTKYPQVKVECVLPIPADSKPQHTDAIVKAALQAGIPSPYPVAEPTAAYTFHIQQLSEDNGPVSQLGSTIVCDLGGGSNDIQLWAVGNTNPVEIREEASGRNAWTGGKSVNQSCRRLIERRFARYMDQITDALSAVRKVTVTKDQFLSEVEAAFEVEKRGFDGYTYSFEEEEITLNFDGLPDIGWGYTKPNKIVLSKRDVRECFDETFNSVKTMIDAVIKEFHRGERADGHRRIQEMLLVGGGSGSSYMQERLRRTYTDLAGHEQSAASYSIPIRMPNDSHTGTSTWIARGALLLLMDKMFIKERVIRRGYCVGWDEEVSLAEAQLDGRKAVRDPADGVLRVPDTAHWLVRLGDHIQPGHQARTPPGCWRALFLDTATADGWALEEHIFFSDEICEEGVSVDDDRIEECGDNLSFFITKEDARQFEVRYTLFGREYLYLEYVVELTIRDNDMKYRVVFPRTGALPAQGYGKDPIKKEGHLNLLGAYKLTNSV